MIDEENAVTAGEEDAKINAEVEAEAKAKAEAEAEAKAKAEAKTTKAKAKAEAEAKAKAEEAEAKAKAEAEAKALADAVQEKINAANIEALKIAGEKAKIAEQEKLEAKKLELTVKNNGARSFEVFTKTELPAGETVVIQCLDQRQRKAIISKFQQLNTLNKNQRYTWGEV